MNHFQLPKKALGTARNQREKIYVLKMPDLILFLDIGFPSYLVRALYTFKKTYPYATQRVDILILKKFGFKVIITLFLILKVAQSRPN